MTARLPGGTAPHLPRLENWLKLGERLTGYVYQDARFPEGTHIWTSAIVSMTEDYAVTCHSRYLLGRPWAPPAARTGKDVGFGKAVATTLFSNS